MPRSAPRWPSGTSRSGGRGSSDRGSTATTTAWDRWARPLVDAAARPAPGDDRLARAVRAPSRTSGSAALADELGWPPSEVNFAYVLDAAAAAALPRPPATACAVSCREDHGLIAPLHELEFPATYYSAAAADRAGGGAASTSCSSRRRRTAASPATPPAGSSPTASGYIDFVAVEPVRPRRRSRTPARQRASSGACCRDDDQARGAPHRAGAPRPGPRAVRRRSASGSTLGFVGYRSPVG